MIRGIEARQNGFSLVELMVAMVLGLVLLGGTIAIYASSKDSYRLQENVAGMQENARFAIAALRRNMELAGFPRVLDIAPFDPAQTLDGGGNNNDQITIRYQSATDCLGNGTPANGPDQGIAVNRYYINNQNNLLCLGNGNPIAQTLVENVDNLQVLYGIDDDGDGSANRYATAAETDNGVISAGTPDWDNVVSLRLALLISSENDIGTAQQAGGFTLLDAPAIKPNDDRLYRVFTTTIPLRNRIP